MAKILENSGSIRRTIRLSANDVISVVREYQRIVRRFSDYDSTMNVLKDTIIYLPEDI